MSTSQNKCWQGCRETETLMGCWWECKTVQRLWETVWRFLNKLNIKLPDDPAPRLLGIHPLKVRQVFKEKSTHKCS